ncbi:hypothetical protein F5Y03DRAFT_73664 [Xylaria venustula]|nr:hypothetical protein F5Y03DRAFT_73664 [Xylaria venustula]
MLRRSHKKTKKGSKCEECRRRHIRCDQQHPSCINCRNSDRICIYRSTDPPGTAEASLPAADTSSNDNTTRPQHGETSQEPSSTHTPLERNLDVSLVNILHLELFNHFIQNSFLFIDKDTAFIDQLKKRCISSAFSNPYLMHGILALSAHHISIQAPPERSQYYLNQSTKLQTWAVTHFNPAPLTPDRDTCVALFLFSSLLCVQGLSDLAHLTLDPEPFFIRFGHYFGLQRGVRTIVRDYWSQLKESELQDLLEWCDRAAQEKGRGSECDDLRHLIAQSEDLSPASIEVCQLAIEQLQCVLDVCGLHQPMPVHCIYLTLAWPFFLHDKFVDLLVLRRPVALIILAYYGVTLDMCRDLWMVGQAGRQIVHAVSVYLGSKWASSLRLPCEAVGIELSQPDSSSTS